MVAVPQFHAMTYLDRERALEHVLDNDSRRYELFAGEEVVSPSPTTRHQLVSGNTFRLIDLFRRANDAGMLFYAPTDVKFSAYDVVVPDLCFVAKERSSIVGDKAIEGAPDLVVEILSPSTRRQDQVRKFALYASAGVREYWLIDVEARGLTIYALRDGQYVPVPERDGTVASVVLTGLVVTVGDLFAGIP